jgi:hypothetical protein
LNEEGIFVKQNQWADGEGKKKKETGEKRRIISFSNRSLLLFVPGTNRKFLLHRPIPLF